MSDTEHTEQNTPLPPATAAVDEKKITKPKAPGRVAAGKKLAELNKKNKAKKDPSSESSDGWDISAVNPGYVIGGLGLIIGAGSLYLQWKSHNTTPQQHVQHIDPPVKEKKKSKIPEME